MCISMPRGMTRLTSLQSFSLSVVGIGADTLKQFEMDWVTCLTDSQKLELSTGSLCRVPPALSALSMLTQVSLSFSGHCATIHVDWQHLSSLHTVTLAGKCKFDHRLLRLAHNLSLSVVLLCIDSADIRSASYSAALNSLFRQHACNVRSNFDGVSRVAM